MTWRTAIAVTGGAALTAVLVTGCGSTTPSAGGAAGGGTPLDASCTATGTDAGLEVTFKVTPCPAKGGGAAGAATITVKDAAGKAVEGAKVEINPEMPNMKMKGGNQSASAQGGGYEAKLVLGMPGDWTVTVVVTPETGKASTTAFDVKAA
ncbi:MULTISPECIES: FixH family protein [unclassified Streptomyces]|uniref:FixH family protein n=1 Tax=unclassified Streptomyces TaxID=2593676 RepID=UPI002E36A792|nr:FixH family protein [Streptomyces sp. NBC_01268]